MNQRGNSPGDDHFRIRPGKPKQRGDTFVSQVLRQAGKAANATGGKRGKAPGSRLGRGHVAARFTGQSLKDRMRTAENISSLSARGSRMTPRREVWL